MKNLIFPKYIISLKSSIVKTWNIKKINQNYELLKISTQKKRKMNMKISGQSEFFWKIKFRISSCEIAFKITCSLLCQFSPVKQDFVKVCFFIFQTSQKLTSVHFIYFFFFGKQLIFFFISYILWTLITEKKLPNCLQQLKSFKVTLLNKKGDWMKKFKNRII